MNHKPEHSGPENAVSLGVDIGGTNIKAGLVQHGKVLSAVSLPTDATQGPQETLARVARLVTDLCAGCASVESVGVGMPGLIREGVLVGASNFPGWGNVPVKALLEECLERRVELFVDVESIALGEYLGGGHVPQRDFFLFTLGTGIGAACVLDGRVFSGAGGFMLVNRQEGAAPLAHCDMLEHLISGPAIVARALAAERPRGSLLHDRANLTVEEIADAARAGDCTALRLWEETGQYLGWAAVNMAHLFLLQRVVVGGGVSRAGDLLLEPARKFFAQYAAPPVAQCEIVASTLQDQAGIVGAALGAAFAAGKDLQNAC